MMKGRKEGISQPTCGKRPSATKSKPAPTCYVLAAQVMITDYHL